VRHLCFNFNSKTIVLHFLLVFNKRGRDPRVWWTKSRHMKKSVSFDVAQDDTVRAEAEAISKKQSLTEQVVACCVPNTNPSVSVRKSYPLLPHEVTQNISSHHERGNYVSYILRLKSWKASHSYQHHSNPKQKIIGGVIGSGNQGKVFKALDSKSGKFVAIKQVSVPRNVEKEIEILQGLDHPNIVKYIDHYKQGGFIYIVFEYVENGSLRDVIEKFGTFPESLVVRMIGFSCGMIHFVLI
jgi:hypothetical protein